jgi:hypothetical protein
MFKALIRRRTCLEPGRQAIGPAPDGSGPLIDATWEVPSSIPVVLRRVER